MAVPQPALGNSPLVVGRAAVAAGAVSSLAELARRQKGLVENDFLPVEGRLQNLLPSGIRRGVVVRVSSASVLLSLLAAPTRAGSWAAIVGFSDLSMLAASEAGVELRHCVLVPATGPRWPVVVAALIDAVDVVVLGKELEISQADARRLSARARERRCTLMCAGGEWPEQPSVSLSAGSSSWQGVAAGHGRLRGRWLDVSVDGRGIYSRHCRTTVWFGDSPAPSVNADTPRCVR